MNAFKSFLSLVERFAIAAGQARNALILFIALDVLLALFLFPSSLSGNEENYFQLGYRAVAPEKFSPFHAVFDASSARFIPDRILGYLVYFFGYDTAHIIGRTGMAALYAASLAFFFRSLRFSVLDALITLVIFRLAGEQILGGEWLFEGVESKTLAYALLFLAFGLVNHRRWNAAIMACAAATYMHFLVGGFWALVILLLQWRDGRNIHSSAKTFGLYCLFALPLVCILMHDQFGAHLSPQARFAADKIYAEIRSPHHTAPFASMRAFGKWLPGIVALCSLTLALAIIVRRGNSRLITVAALAGLAWLLLALLISFLDRKTLIFAKLYLFRPSSLTLFFAITAFTGIMKDNLSAYGQRVKSLAICAVILPFAAWQAKEQISFMLKTPTIPERPELVAAIEAHSLPGDIVLIEPYDEMDPEYIRLHRDIPRPTLVAWKFVPTNPKDILYWYSLIQLRQAIFSTGCTQKADFPIRWLVTLQPDSLTKVRNCGPVIWQKGNLALVKVINYKGLINTN